MHHLIGKDLSLPQRSRTTSGWWHACSPPWVAAMHAPHTWHPHRTLAFSLVTYIGTLPSPGHPWCMLPSWVPTTHAPLPGLPTAPTLPCPGTCQLHPLWTAQASGRGMPRGLLHKSCSWSRRANPSDLLCAGTKPAHSHGLAPHEVPPLRQSSAGSGTISRLQASCQSTAGHQFGSAAPPNRTNE